MSTLSVIALFALFIHLSVGIYALSIEISNKMNRLFFLECLSLAVWSLTAAVIYSSISRSEVILWYKISSFGFGLYYALVLHLNLLFTKTNLSKIKIAAIYTPTVIVILSTWFSYTLFEDFILISGKWKFIPAFYNAGFYVYAVYYILYIVTTIILLISWQKRSRSKKEKLQSRIISLSYFFTVVLCTTTDFILPGLPWYKLPALAPILLLINTGAIFYVLQKYRFLKPVENIFSNDQFYLNKDILILIDSSQSVITANRSFCDYFSFTKDEVTGSLLDEIFIIGEMLSESLVQMTLGRTESCSGITQYNNGMNTVYFHADCSRVIDRFSDFVGNLISISEINSDISADESTESTIPKKKKIQTVHKPVSYSSEEKINRVVKFINENYTFDISREGIASAVGMNPDNLSRIFNKVTGKRIDAYINELRINSARQKLAETEKQIINISMEIGFENLRTFNRIFRDLEGMTPKEYREKKKSMMP